MANLKILSVGIVPVIGLKTTMVTMTVKCIAFFFKEYPLNTANKTVTDDVDDSEDTNQPKKVIGRLSSRMLIPGNTWQTVWIAGIVSMLFRQLLVRNLLL